MAGTNPIIDLATINDMQTRLAAIEAALGKYNSSTAVTAAAETGAAAATGGLPPASSGSNTGSGSSQYVPTQDIILSGVQSFNLRNTINGLATGTATVYFSTAFPSAPVVVATAGGVDSRGLPLLLSASIGNIDNTKFQVRVTNLSGASIETVNIYYIATTRK